VSTRIFVHGSPLDGEECFGLGTIEAPNVGVFVLTGSIRRPDPGLRTTTAESRVDVGALRGFRLEAVENGRGSNRSRRAIGASSIDVADFGKVQGMTRRLARWIIPFTVVLVLNLPAVGVPSQALDVSPGPWEGEVLFDGALISTVRRVVDSSEIIFTATVNANGDVTDGTMSVDILWSDSGGEASSDHHEFGTLTLGGGVDRLVAAGTLTHDTLIYDSKGSLIPEPSGTREEEVSWIFSASNTTCALLSGTLDEAEGRSFLRSTLISSGDEYSNGLVVAYHAWPANSSGAVEVAESVADLADIIQEALASETPSPGDLAAMVIALEAVRNSAVKLELCDFGLDLTTDTGEDVLAVLMNELIAKVLEQADQYSPQQLIKLLNIGVRSGAVTPKGGVTGADEVYATFGDVLSDALDAAIADADAATILDITTAARQYGFSDLYERGSAAHEALP
jgi:hypothetical protein